MKNILYVGPYKQNDGWGYAARDYLKSISYACQKLGYNLKASPIYLSGNIDNNIPEDIKDHEKTIISGKFDTIIQKALPQAICPIYPYKNIALCVFEQRNLGHSSYIKQVFGRMDGVWVPSKIEKDELIKAGIQSTHNISQPIDCDEIDSSIALIEKEKFDLLKLNSKYKNHTKFYFVGSFTTRKNIMNLIIAFSNEFKINDKAILIIKTDHMSQQQREMIIKNIKDILSSSKYNKELRDNVILITDRMDRNQLLALHYSCDSFVCPSRGEAFCRPLAESIRIGKYPIAVNGTGSSELIDTNIGGLIIPSHLEYVEPNPSNVSLDHECELEQWCEPSMVNIRKTLRKTHSYLSELNNTEKADLSMKLKNYANKFSIQSIGDNICSLDIM
jgi:glycosyltransferase involved in cell wall biosynthesis